VSFTNTSTWFSQKRRSESHAAAKVITGKDGKILGAHLFGLDYAELINFFLLAIKLGLTAQQLKAMPAAYRTAVSDVGSVF
jgi:glutathione reductase (NADPH)